MRTNDRTSFYNYSEFLVFILAPRLLLTGAVASAAPRGPGGFVMNPRSRFFGVLLLAVGCTGNIDGGRESLAPVIGADDPRAIPGQYIVVLKGRGADAGLVGGIADRVSFNPG